MKNLIPQHKFLFIVLTLVVCMAVPTPAFAWWGMGYQHPEGYHWYGGHWWLGQLWVDLLPLGTIVAALPPSPRVIYTQNIPYYYDGRFYFRVCPGGYEVVPAPVMVEPVIPMPPPVRREIVPVAPYPRAVWVPGRWQWEQRHHRYDWTHGHWRKR